MKKFIVLLWLLYCLKGSIANCAEVWYCLSSNSVNQTSANNRLKTK